MYRANTTNEHAVHFSVEMMTMNQFISRRADVNCVRRFLWIPVLHYPTAQEQMRFQQDGRSALIA